MLEAGGVAARAEHEVGIVPTGDAGWVANGHVVEAAVSREIVLQQQKSVNVLVPLRCCQWCDAVVVIAGRRGRGSGSTVKYMGIVRGLCALLNRLYPLEQSEKVRFPDRKEATK